MTADMKMATAQLVNPFPSNRDNDLLQEVERLRREVAMLEQQHGGLQEDMGEEEGYAEQTHKSECKNLGDIRFIIVLLVVYVFVFLHLITFPIWVQD